MKLRQGFVTNSSSSNFVVAVKGDLEKILRDNFAPYYSDGKGVGRLINSILDELVKIMSEVAPLDLEKFEEKYGEYGGDYYERIKRLIEEGYNVYETRLSTDSFDSFLEWNLEPGMAAFDFDIEGKNLRLYNSGF